jgi:serine/threonine protein phosphatase PrpC
MPLKFGLAQHDGYKSPSEDFITHKIYANGYELFGVFDGHNSYYYPKEVSRILPEILNEYFHSLISLEEIVKILYIAFEKTEQYLLTGPPSGGTTATISIVTDDHIITASLGDSIALYFDNKGALLANTNDHNTSSLEECTRIKKAGGLISYDIDGEVRVNGTLALTRSFGDHSYKNSGVISKPDIYCWIKEPGYLAILSDGFTENRNYSFLFESYISNKYQIDELASYIYSFIEPDLEAAASNAVNTQANKFKSLFRNIYYGDNTSLIFVQL